MKSNLSEIFYPLLFQPNLHSVVWGGDRIKPWKGLGTESLVGESWEVSAIPSSPSVVANGSWAGSLLTDVIAHSPEQFLGHKVSQQNAGQLPLLAKFIDARDNLSIQVHPNDEMAQREHGLRGKSEMWYVIDAQPGSFLYAGFKDEITPEEFKRLVEESQSNNKFSLLNVLARYEVHPGDVFYLPAGRVHAIGAGILLSEIQQSSDVTYRIFDYNRPGMDGRPRELHTDLAARALDFTVHSDYQTDYVPQRNAAVDIIDSHFFGVRLLDVDEPIHRDLLSDDSFCILMCTDGECRLRVRATGDEVLLREGYSCLIPAVIADYDILPQGHARLLEASVTR